MADKTLIVNGQPFTINRDRKAEVSQLTVNGQPFTINRTAPVIESDRKGESRPLLSKVVGGASAAYSLRDLNSKQGDTNVANVRRSTDNTEKIFQAKDVHTIDEWVNGKQETTLPCDVATAAAAYSLRKVKSDYTGNAVRIRRSTDLIEVNVAFDSEGKVSVNSPVTNLVEPFGIERGSTSATTLGGFLTEGGTNYDAFVVYWYNQAGSNDAFNITHNSQPQIASSGALLDGIKFNAATNGTSPKFLQVSTRLGVTTDHFVSVVFNGYQTDTDNFGAFLNTRNGNAGFQYGIAGSTSDKVQALYYAGAGNNANSSSNNTLPNNNSKRLVTFDKDGDTLTGFANSATNGISISNAMNTPSTTLTNIGVGGNVGTTTSLGLRANINELIVYETDQADNRFKIESNINNYYGLYNDENELAGNFTVDSSGTGTDASISNESKTGFTATVADKAGFFGADLNEAVPNGSNLYISFNANLSPNGGTEATPNFGLANSSDKTGNSTGSPLDTAVVEGFNSITIAGTASTCNRIRFTEGNDNVSFTISDIKVSRVSRDGRVETWYDQSGNGYNMTQEQDSLQPYRIQNGGTHDGCFAPRNLATSGTKVHLSSDFGNQHFPANTTKLCYIVVGENITALGSGNNKGTIFGAFRGVGNYIAGQHGLVIQPNSKFEWYYGVTSDANDFQNSTLVTTGDNDLETKKVLLIASVDNTSVTLSSNNQSNTTTPTRNTGAAAVDLNLTGAASTDSNRNYIRLFAPNRDSTLRPHNYSYGTIKEAILYADDQDNNLPAIKANINNQYQIY